MMEKLPAVVVFIVIIGLLIYDTVRIQKKRKALRRSLDRNIEFKNLGGGVSFEKKVYHENELKDDFREGIKDEKTKT